MGDASLQFVNDGTDQTIMRAIHSINGGEVVNE